MERGVRLQEIAARCWRFLASRRLSVFLLLGAVALLLVGAFLPQPAETVAGERARSADAAFRTARSLALQGVAVALLLNGLACTVDRAGRLWRAATRAVPEVLPDEAYGRAPWREEGVQPGRLPRRLRWLHQVGISPTGARFYYGERGRWVPLGTLFTHLGLLLFLIAAIAHSTGSRATRVVLEPTTPAVLPGRECRLALAEVAGEHPGGTVWVEVESGGQRSRIRLAPARPARACGMRMVVSTYGLAWQARATSAQGQDLPISYPEGAQWLRFAEGETAATFAIPAQGITGTVIPSPAGLSGRPGEPLRLRLGTAGGEVLFDGTVEPEGQREVGGILLAWRTGIFLEVQAVVDPGFPWLVAGGSSLVVGACLVLWGRPRRVWARWTPDGVLAVRTDRGPLLQ